MYRDVQTIAHALDTSSESISFLRRALGREKVETIIKLQLIYLNELLNLKRSLTELQVDEIAAEVVSIHSSLQIVDVYLIMRRARTGYYGEFYESINMPKVLKWFSDYFEERCEVAANRSLDARTQAKEYNDTTRTSCSQQEREEFSAANAAYQIIKRK